MRHPVHDVVIVCDEPIHDFGTIWGSQDLRHAVEIRNDGTEDAFLRLSHISTPSCHFIIEPRQTVYAAMALRSEKLRSKFNKHVNLSFVENVDEMRCTQCEGWMNGERHLQQCGEVCFEPMSSEGCVLLERPEWAVEP
jgi:hypothetical protein